MTRANRYFIPNHVWHITHRCHKKEFLLKFARDRRRWRYQDPPTRYAVIDQSALLEIFGLRRSAQLRKACRGWIVENLRSGGQIRNSEWSESLAVGTRETIDAFKGEFGMRGVFRESIVSETGQVLKETPATYMADFTGRMAALRGNNSVPER